MPDERLRSVASGTVQFARPPSYPTNGTYADLLFWHLYVWGTRPGGSVTARGTSLWTEEEFVEGVFARGKGSPEAEPKNYSNWIGKSKNCLAPGPYYGPIISGMLFGGETQFQIWENDLKRAQGESSGKGNNTRAITLDTALAELARAGLIDQSASPAPNVVGAAAARKHMAAAARENVALIVRRLAEFFVGRADDIDAIDKFVGDRMAGGGKGLLVITAPPGFGKSALAAHWCARAEAMPHRRVVKHFCSISAGEATTSLENIYANLHQQIAECLGESVDQSADFDALVALLKRPMPDDKQLVIWLDGVDEADGKIACFLPTELGRGICVIVSARADVGSIPAYLSPWLADAMAASHRPIRLSLDKLSLPDVKVLVSSLFAANGLVVPQGLAPRIFRASDHGYALFVLNMTESAIEAGMEGRDVDLGEAPESLLGYAKSELKRLRGIDRWPDVQPVFAFLTIAREAIKIDELQAVLGKHVFPETFPRELSRWLSFVEVADRKTPPLLSFAHPLLAEVFGRALAWEQSHANDYLCDRLIKEPRSQWPRYAWRYLPQHMLESGHLSQAASLLADQEFIADRLAALGHQECPKSMAADWMGWYAILRREGKAVDSLTESMRHLRFWNNYASQIADAALERVMNTCDQLMYDVALASEPVETRLSRPQPLALPLSLATLWGHRSLVVGALELRNGHGFLSWSWDRTLQLWKTSGEGGPILYGHRDTIDGAIELAENAGFLSWSSDATLRLWGPRGEEGPVLRGHTSGITGAIELEDGEGYLSWSYDGTLRFWGRNGETGPILRGHKGGVVGAIALDDRVGYLSWGYEGTLRLWGRNGEKGPVLRGHTDHVMGALALEGHAGFLSWSRDGTLRLWGPAGERGKVLRGHTDLVLGALVVEKGAGFLSWSSDGTLRLWTRAGEMGPKLTGHSGSISGLLALKNDAGFLSWGSDGLCLWSLTGEKLAALNCGIFGASGAAELASGRGFVSWSMDGSLQIWGAAGETGPVLRGHDEIIQGVQPLERDAGFLSWSNDGTLRLWGPSAGYSPGPNDAYSRVYGALVLEGRFGFLSWSYDGTLQLWDRAGEKGPVLSGHTGWVQGALALENGSGFLSWSIDGTLRLWGPSGEERRVLNGQEGSVRGAFRLKDNTGFVSWSNHSIRLWGPSGDERRVLSEHEDFIRGVLLLPNDAGFLSWSQDHSLRLWGENGENGPVLHGHDDMVYGAIALQGRAGFLSWSGHDLRLWGPMGENGPTLRGHEENVTGACELEKGGGLLSWSHDGTLRLWTPTGEKGPVLRGHDRWVKGALALEAHEGFLSWSGDHTLRLWGAAGEDGPVLRGHTKLIMGALALKGDLGFLSWSDDGSLRLWSSQGKLQNMWISPNGAITSVEPFGEPDHYLVVFGGNVGIVYLAH